MNNTYKISVFITENKIEEVFIYDDLFIYPLIDIYSFGLKPIKINLLKTNSVFKKKLEETSTKINEKTFNELKKL